MNPVSDYTMTINGRSVPALETIAVINPATGRVFAQAPDASSLQLDEAVNAATVAFAGWKATPIAERQKALANAAKIIIEHADELGALFVSEQGRPFAAAKQEVQYAAYWLKQVAKRTLPVDVVDDTPAQRIEVHHEPLGVVCAIVPWNFPVLLAAWKIAPALLTGNTLVLKPSPFTPLCMLRIGALIKDCFPPGVLNIISGGDNLGPLMTSHPGFAKISFTGSTATGKRVMEAASRDLKRITLELGGNDAAIVLPDVNVAEVAEKIFNGAFFNTAQICIATKRLYVHEAVYDQLRDRLHALAKAAKVGDGAEQGIMYGPIQNLRQYDRVLDLLHNAEAEGLTLLRGGPVPEEGYFIPLTIVDNPPESSRVVREEAFGPILPMLKFNDLDDVIRKANATDYGLAGAVWSADVEKALSVAHRLDTGTVWINTNLETPPNAPLSGHKQSGFGVENGLVGLLEFTQIKTIYIPKVVAAG